MTRIEPYAALDSIGPEVGRLVGRHLDLAFRGLARGKSVTNEAGYLRLLSGEPHPLGNFAVLSAPANLYTAREAVEPLAAAAVPSAVLFPGIEVPDRIAAYLVDSGYVAHGSLPAMAADIARLKPTALPDGYEFVRIGGGTKESEDWVRQFAIGYELPLGVARHFSPAAVASDTGAGSPVQFFAIRRRGEIVATSALFLGDGVAGIYSVSTIPAERRKGLGEHATAMPLRIAAGLGYGVGVLQSSETGYSVYRKLGFGDFGGVPMYVRIPG